VRDDSKDNSGVYAIGESPPYPRIYATQRQPVNPISIGPMNCLKEDLNLMLKNMPINVMVPTKISNSIDITSLQMKKPFTGVGKWPAFND
jgi:hypothetical protein